MTTQSVRPFRSEQAKAEFAELYARRAAAWPVASETMELETQSGRTFVRASGRATDPPLILLSGMRGTSLMWKPNIAALSAGYRVYALETINDVGWSVARREIKAPDDLVRWLDEVLGLLVPNGPVNLVGMSYGGWLASLYALRFPGRVRRVVLLAPGGTVLRFSFWFYVRVMYHALRLPGSQGDAFRRTLRWIFSDMVASGEAGRAYVEEEFAAVLKSGRLFALPRLVWPTVLDDAAWRRFSVPALFLVGEHEKIYSPRAALRRLARVAPGVRAEIVPGAGHDLTFVQPGLVAAKVLEFLAA